MADGIVCKVWNIQGGSASKSTWAQLNDSIGYALNDEKTSGEIRIDPLNQMMREVHYAENDLKTFDGALVGYHNLASSDVNAAVHDMMEVKKHYNKTGGRAALHMIISLPESESGMDSAPKLMQLCSDVLKDVFPGYQAIFAIHTNTENMHAHIIINSVGLDGKKIHQDKAFVRNVLHKSVNRYAVKYGFSANKKWEPELSATVAESKNDSKKSFPEIKIMLRNEIDRAVERSESFDEFCDIIRNDGYFIHVGKYISIRSDDMKKAVRTHNLGSNYTKDAIVERISTKRDQLAFFAVSGLAGRREEDPIFTPVTVKMKKYKDMSEQEKKNVIRLIRLGRNPWRENTKMNWQLNNIADDLNRDQRISSYLEAYSTDGTIQSGMEGLLELKETISEEKKQIYAAKRKYMPLIRIYEEMKPLARRAYLYEKSGIDDYRNEYDRYRELSNRLRDGYSKDAGEVSAFIKNCDEQISYANAQLSELSMEYRELKRYGIENGYVVRETSSLIDLAGFYDEKKDERSGVFDSDVFYAASSRSNIIVRVEKTPDVDSRGYIYEEYRFTFMTRDGRIVRELDNKGNNKDFGRKLSAIQKQYNLSDCKKFTSIQTAKEFAVDTPVKLSATVAESEKGSHPDFTGSSFAQGINHIFDDRPVNVVVDSTDPNFLVVSSKEDGQLKLMILNRDFKYVDTAYIPLVKDKNSEGFKTIQELQEKYGFSDSVIEFSSVDDYRSYEDERKNVSSESSDRKRTKAYSGSTL